MKSLFVLRHAKSDAHGGGRDFDRPLNARGRDDARRLGRDLAQRAVRFDAVVASPAVRVLETLAGIEVGSGGPLSPRFDQRIYSASEVMLAAIVRETDDSVDSLLLVGHNPAVHTLVLALTEDDPDGLRGQVSARYSAGALSEITLQIEHWSAIGEQLGRIVRFVAPDDLA